MYIPNAFLITPVANGFVLQIPFDEEQPQIRMPDLSFLKGLMPGKDDVLDKVKENADKAKAETEKLLNSIKPLKVDQSMYVFKTLREVVAFILSQYPEL